MIFFKLNHVYGLLNDLCSWYGIIPMSNQKCVWWPIEAKVKTLFWKKSKNNFLGQKLTSNIRNYLSMITHTNTMIHTQTRWHRRTKWHRHTRTQWHKHTRWHTDTHKMTHPHWHTMTQAMTHKYYKRWLIQWKTQ